MTTTAITTAELPICDTARVIPAGTVITFYHAQENFHALAVGETINALYADTVLARDLKRALGGIPVQIDCRKCHSQGFTGKRGHKIMCTRCRGTGIIYI